MRLIQAPVPNPMEPTAKLTPRAKVLWDRMMAMRSYSPSDVPALTMLVQTEARAAALADAVDIGAFQEDAHELAGLFVKDPESGKLKASAAYLALAQERGAAISMREQVESRRSGSKPLRLIA